MRLFLHLIVSKEPPLFNSRWSNWVKSELRRVQYFDVDNTSEAAVIETAIKALDEAKSVVVFVESDQSQPGPIFKVLKRLTKLGNCVILHKGNNQMIDKLSLTFSKKWQTITKDEQVEKNAKFFFNNSD